jgi:hypothetical protein
MAHAHPTQPTNRARHARRRRSGHFRSSRHELLLSASGVPCCTSPCLHCPHTKDLENTHRIITDSTLNVATPTFSSRLHMDTCDGPRTHARAPSHNTHTASYMLDSNTRPNSCASHDSIGLDPRHERPARHVITNTFRIRRAHTCDQTHGMVYSNILPPNHNITMCPALQDRRFIGGIGKQRLLLPWLSALPREVAAKATIEAPALAGAAPAPACS